MSRFLAACFLAFLCGSICAPQQTSQTTDLGPNESRSPSPLALALLQESHDLGLQLASGVRLSLLRRQVQMATSLDASLSREWANELSLLLSQEKGIRRSAALESANATLAGMDPDRALDLLHRMRMEADSENTITPPKVALARRVFPLVVLQEGERALPTLEQEAQKMAIEGHYPYSALAYATMQAISTEWSSNRAHAVEMLDSEFELAWQYYRQNPRNYFDDLEFAQMLQVVSGGLPHESLRPALAALVNNLLGTDAAKYRLQAKLIDSAGRIYRADNGIDAALLFFGTVINRIDPGLAQKLESSRPALNPALNHAKDGEAPSLSIEWSDTPSQPSTDFEATRENILRMAFVAPEQAILRAKLLPKGERQIVELDVARTLAGDSPEKAAELISDVQAQEPSPDGDLQANLLSAQVSLAAVQGNKDELRDLLERAFSQTNASVSQQFLAGHVYVPGCGALVQIGIQNEPDLTVSFIRGLAPTQLRAELLLAAAAALNMPGRLPVRHHPQQIPPKHEQ